MDVMIRKAAFEDVKQLQALYIDFFAYNSQMQPKYYKEAEVTEEYPKSVITSDKEAIFVAEADGNAVGFIHMQENHTPPYKSFVPHKYAEIIEFFVAAEFRRQGIGLKLFNAARIWSKGRKLDYIEAMVLANAKGEIQFYEKEGFRTKAHIMRHEL